MIVEPGTTIAKEQNEPLSQEQLWVNLLGLLSSRKNTFHLVNLFVKTGYTVRRLFFSGK